MDPSLILFNAKIYTLEPTSPWAEALAINGKEIAAVGRNDEILPLAGPATQTIDLSGRLVLPGLCDAHIHFYDWSLSRRQVPVASCGSKGEMLAVIWKWAQKSSPGSWLTGRGWNENLWPEKSLPTRSDLDRVTSSTQPAIFWRSDMHAAVANSAALRLAGIKSSIGDPAGGVIGRDSEGEPNGLLWELAINIVSQYLPKPEAAELEEAMLDAMDELHRLGVTAIHDQRMKDQDEGPLALAAYQRLMRDERLKLRLNCNVAAHELPSMLSLGLRYGFGNEYLRLGHVKLFADGTMGSKTAWMLDPYSEAKAREPDYTGICLTLPDQMADEIRISIEAGFPVSVHAIGDQANRVVLDIFEELAGSTNQLPVPHRIEHVQIIDPADLPRLGGLDLTASVQPIHALDDMHIAEDVLGERAVRTYNFGSLAASGAMLALGSDAPVANPNPFLGFHAAICRQRPDRMDAGPWFGNERLTLEQAIYGYTLGAAQAVGWQQLIGSVTPGKRADLIVLERDLFSLVSMGVTGAEIADTKVAMTLFDGEVVFQV
jgi:predicted amidohydrolase YtcJ